MDPSQRSEPKYLGTKSLNLMHFLDVISWLEELEMGPICKVFALSTLLVIHYHLLRPSNPFGA